MFFVILTTSHHTRMALFFLTGSIYTSIVALAFAITSFLLVVYDRLVTRRQQRTKNAALKVVASMFPASVQDKVLKGAYEGGQENDKSNIIASFFPETTVMFADISGFTAWASTREPVQVFHLLETIYGAFDEIARRSQIFKVETVGDCYVAVAGVPQPRRDHAVAMVRFARDCHARMRSLSHQLEISLGPDTADLAFRIGIHSGPVTGGVLRGQNSRFQLFGDTMNMAAVSIILATTTVSLNRLRLLTSFDTTLTFMIRHSYDISLLAQRMETSGSPNRIHLSSDTAEILLTAGKGGMIEKREEQINVKGKGPQTTYWVRVAQDRPAGSKSSESASNDGGSIHRLVSADVDETEFKAVGMPAYQLSRNVSPKIFRLVEWNVAVLTARLQAIQLHRNRSDLIDLRVIDQLQRHVHGIATMYRDNPFHNFEVRDAGGNRSYLYKYNSLCHYPIRRSHCI